ncbi:type II toxin-antitoxin system PemK/MazF family toxin [Roseofilum sp. BLCC_M91]|uniref:Type II toxin-antitoxin system PemK/MazF family toxin n=1 Tax=Roseofilum halophilum BLCC-M91 TaxID=3022259 RepID=A0ABT7BL36_9CYAN|nr:type II toxin-antitoxin system PemK/MazF family toxin [Roseofilum halophilum]MDJ1179904.1 type II toxin-antitoxin system PemK/MazF family toxin [Roseofilum halophilum BLCC-M91]
MTQPKPTVSRGDVALVLFPNSNLTSAKTRPALIVQADNLQTGLSQIIVAMVTSQMFRAGHPSRVTVLLNSPVGGQSGLLTDSVIMTDNLATISLAAVYRVIGSIPTSEIDIALRHTLGL